MKRTLLISFIILIFAVAGAEGRDIGMNLIAYNGTIDIVSARGPVLAGLYPEVISRDGKLSAADGSLRMGVATETASENDELGEYVTTTVEYKDVNDKAVLFVRVRMYTGAPAAAIGIIYKGEMKPSPEGGLKLVMGMAPGFERGMGAERFKLYWTRPAFANDLKDFPRETQYVVWKDRRAGYAAAIPLVGGGMKTTFSPSGGALAAELSSYDVGFRPKGAPVLAVAWGDDPYETTNRLYRAGMAFMDNPGKLRVDKGYPEVFEKIGWCSWNAFYSKVTEADIFRAAESFKRKKFPLGFLIVDDGWQDTGSNEATRKNRRLHGFGAIKDKFPGGVAGLVSKLKNEYGIPEVGFWHAYQGYWDGVAKDSELGRKYKDNLFQTFDGRLIPDPVGGKGRDFFMDYHRSLKEAGAGMVKVDNQSTIYPFTLNRIPIGFAARGWQENLQTSVRENFNNAVINCMCMTIENIYFWKDSNISRNSDDFFPDIPGNARIHAIHNIYNSMWHSELAYPDFDMFQSHHPQAKMHSVLRAVSGGPVYITDTPGLQNWDILWKLIFRDGRILRPDIPARPTRDTLLVDTFEEAAPLKAFTRVGGSGLVAAFNVFNGSSAVEGSVSPSDVEGLEGEKFAVYEHFSKQVKLLGREEKIPVKLEEYGSALYTVVPVSGGAAPIGLLKKYVSYKGITEKECSGKDLKVKLIEGGMFGAYMEKKPSSVTVGGKSLKAGDWTYESDLLKFDAAGEGPVEIIIGGGCG